MSSRPCVGCEWRPSPALTTCTCGAQCCAMRYGAPLSEWRTTNMSACIADRLAIVSSRLSPLAVLERAMSRLMTSADRRLAAISNVVRVRVDASKKRLNTLLPRSSGTFLTSRSVTPPSDSAVSRICTRISRGSPSMESRCWSSPLALSCGLRTVGLQREGELAVVTALQAQPLPRRHFELRPRVLGADRKLPAAAVGKHHEADAFRATVVEQLIHRGADGAPAVEHV